MEERVNYDPVRFHLDYLRSSFCPPPPRLALTPPCGRMKELLEGLVVEADSQGEFRIWKSRREYWN